MKKEMMDLINNLELNEGAAIETINDVQTLIQVTLPEDYVEFLTHSNGAKGFLGNSYLVLWAIEQIPIMNTGYKVSEFAPSLILFGTDMGGEAFAFDKSNEELMIVRVPFIGMGIDEPKTFGRSFLDFLSQIFKQE